MFIQILNLISFKALTSQVIDYTLLTVAFFTFFVLVNNVINAIKVANRYRALSRVKI
ncbi:hypothetical protein [Polaribacter reichenbachii]|uniref:hypothetical protein n=1 Tax=Polaribacter reichenbachii TaxID=996801 RepID=UPI0012FA6C08|nr:hypothetical protein [Polaribacter reichenbachii]